MKLNLTVWFNVNKGGREKERSGGGRELTERQKKIEIGWRNNSESVWKTFSGRKQDGKGLK